MSERVPTVDDLVAKPEIDPFEGAGIVSDAADVYTAVTRPTPHRTFEDSFQIGTATTGLALSALGARDDPLDAVLGSVLGWLIEHLEFLREPLDQLAGNPREVKAHAQTWHNVGRELSLIADAQADALSRLQGWSGSAADAYRGAAGREGDALRHTAASAEELARVILENGAAVGTIRSIVRDMIVEFLIALGKWLVPVLATATATGGASLAPYIAGAVARGLELAAEIVALISKLLKHLDEVGLVLGKLAVRVDEVAAGLGGGARVIRTAGAEVAERGPRDAGQLRQLRDLGHDVGGPSLADTVRSYGLDQGSTATVVDKTAEPFTQEGTAIRDRDGWAEADQTWKPLR